MKAPIGQQWEKMSRFDENDTIVPETKHSSGPGLHQLRNSFHLRKIEWQSKEQCKNCTVDKGSGH